MPTRPRFPTPTAATAVTCFGAVMLFLMLAAVAVTGSPLVAAVFIVALVMTILIMLLGTSPVCDAIFVLAFFAVPWNAVAPIPGLASLELSDIFFVGGFLLAVPRYFSARLELPPLFTAGAVGLTVVAALAMLVQRDHQTELVYFQDVIQGTVILPVLLVWWRPGRRAILAAGGAYILGNTVSVISAVREGPVAAGRYDGLTTHPNAFGTCCLLSLAILPFLIKSAWPSTSTWLFAASATISVYGIWISGSRAALAIAAVLTVLYPVLDRSTRAGLGLLALSVPVLLVVPRAAENPDSSNALGRLLGGGESNLATHARVSGSKELLDVSVRHPLVGNGWSDVWKGHDIYLQTAAAIGVVGLFFLLMILVSMLAPLVKVRGVYGWLAFPAMAAVLNGFIDPALGVRYIWAPMVLALCAARLAREHRAAQTDEQPRSDDPMPSPGRIPL